MQIGNMHVFAHINSAWLLTSTMVGYVEFSNRFPKETTGIGGLWWCFWHNLQHKCQYPCTLLAKKSTKYFHHHSAPNKHIQISAVTDKVRDQSMYCKHRWMQRSICWVKNQKQKTAKFRMGTRFRRDIFGHTPLQAKSNFCDKNQRNSSSSFESVWYIDNRLAIYQAIYVCCICIVRQTEARIGHPIQRLAWKLIRPMRRGGATVRHWTCDQ